jgi:hypothetical protein
MFQRMWNIKHFLLIKFMSTVDFQWLDNMRPTALEAVEDLANEVQTMFNQTLPQWAVRLTNTPEKQNIFHLLYTSSLSIDTVMTFLELRPPNIHDLDSPNDASDITGLIQLAKICARFIDENCLKDFMWHSAPEGLRLDSKTWGHANAMVAASCIDTMTQKLSTKSYDWTDK